MNKLFKFLMISIGLFSSIHNANAIVVSWTFKDIFFDRPGFASIYLEGSLSFDADTNTFSNSTLVSKLTNQDPAFPGFPILLGNTSNANGLSLLALNILPGSLSFLTPLTNNGGTVFLSSGNFTSSPGNELTLRTGQSISAPLAIPVPEPVTVAMMLSGLGLLSVAARRNA